MKFNLGNDNQININVVDDNAINYNLENQDLTDLDLTTSEEVGMEFGSNDNIDFEMGTRISGTTDYNLLSNKPSINEVLLIGNKNSSQLHLQDEMDYLTNAEIEVLLDNFV